MKEGGGNGHGEDPGKNAHSNEVISAVPDEGNLGEEEDDDFKDLYGDLDLQSYLPQQLSAPPPSDNVTQASGSTAYEREGVGNQGMRGSGQLPAQSVGRGRNKNDTDTGTVTDSGGAVRVGCNIGQRVVFVQELNYWTSDAEVEGEVCKYGMVKEMKFFEEKESGKSKGTCKVKFYDSGAAAACQAGMNGHVFDGRPCVVSFSPPHQDCRTQETGVSKPAQMSGSSLGRGHCGSDSNEWGNRDDDMRPPPMGLNPALGRRMGDYGLGECMHVPPPVSGMMQPPTPVWRMMQPLRRPPPPVWGMPGCVSNVNPSFIGRGMSMDIGMWQDRTSKPNVAERGREAGQDHGNGESTGSQLRVARQANDERRRSSSRERTERRREPELDREEDRKRKR